MSIRRVFRVLIHHLMDVLLLICLFVCFCFVTGHAPCLPCLRGRSCTIDTPWQTHSSFKAKVKVDIISPLFTISPESHPSFNQQFSSLCYSELIDSINFYLSQLYATAYKLPHVQAFLIIGLSSCKRKKCMRLYEPYRYKTSSKCIEMN